MAQPAISVAQFDLLPALGAREGITQQELAESLLVTKGNMFYHLVRMEERDLVTRRRDGRKKRLYLTVKDEVCWMRRYPGTRRW